MKKKLWIALGVTAAVFVILISLVMGLHFLQTPSMRSLPEVSLFAPASLKKATDRWIRVSEKQCYLLENGRIATGWADIAAQRYYFCPDGSLYTGWLELEGERYYLKEDGSMAKGQLTLDGVEHFFTSTGKYVLLVNHNIPVPADYETEIVDLENVQISQTALAALQEMLAAARAEGHPCSMTSGYRARYVQQAIWDRNVRTNMEAGCSYSTACAITARTVMTPGRSEHQTGLAIDFNDSQRSSIQWLQENCWDYGFILRYPPEKTQFTGIVYEPWHYRYVGKELALELKELGLCLEEYMQMLTDQNE